MEFVEQEAELYNPSQVPEDAQGMPQYYDPEDYAAQAGASQGAGYGMFAQGNDLRVIQEYNHEEGIPALTRRAMWGLASKSISLSIEIKPPLMRKESSKGCQSTNAEKE